MNYKYTVIYAFEINDGFYTSTDEQGGYGQIDIITDHEPSTQDDFNEIAKQVFRAGNNYKQVKILKVIDNNKELPSPESEILEGEIIE